MLFALAREAIDSPCAGASGSLHSPAKTYATDVFSLLRESCTTCGLQIKNAGTGISHCGLLQL